MQEVAVQAKIIKDRNEGMSVGDAIEIALDDSGFEKNKDSIARVKSLYFRTFPKKQDNEDFSEEENEAVEEFLDEATDKYIEDSFSFDNEDVEKEDDLSGETTSLLPNEDFYDDEAEH